MLEVPQNKGIPAPDPARPGTDRDFGTHVDTGRHGLIRRFVTTSRHAWGLGLGSLVAHVRALPKSERWRLRYLLLRMILAVVALPVNRKLKRQPFPVQLRRRLERLGPTYIKLGQILSLREDLLPARSPTSCKNLLDRLPAVPYPAFLELVTRHLGRPVDEVFAHIRSPPLGSASIGQIHLATLHRRRAGHPQGRQAGHPRDAQARHDPAADARRRRCSCSSPRYQPRRVIAEFCDYTLREVDLSREADNAETFASSFQDQPDIVFPRIYREYCNENLLCMEYLDGIKPTDPKARGAARRTIASDWSTSAPRRSSACSTATASSTPTCTRRT